MSDSVAGHQQVAAFLLSLDPETARSVLRHIKRDVVDDVARAMVDLDPRLRKEGTVDELYRALAVSLHRPRRVAPVQPAELGTLLSASFGQAESESILAKIDQRRSTERPFADSERHPPRRIARALGGESAAVCALVLGYLDPKKAAEILALLPEEKALDAVRRLARLEAPAPSMLRIVAAKLAARLGELEAKGESDGVDRMQTIAELLNNSSPEIEKKVIETLSSDDAELAAELREHMFTWEDIATIDKRAMQKILGAVDTKTLSVALKAATPAVEQNLMDNLSSRVRDMVLEEREIAGAVSMSVVQNARDEILRNIRAMIESGEFKPSRGGEELVV